MGDNVVVRAELTWYIRPVSRPGAMRSHPTTLWVTGLVVLLLGCGDHLPEPYWEGEHIIFAAEDPERVCGGTAEYMDRRAGELFEKLGTDPVQVEFYLLNDVADYCLDDDTVGCTVGSVVYVERVPLLHEIVHARANDGLPPGLEEGLATYLGDPHPTFAMAPRERIEVLLTQGLQPETGADYGRAAHFIAFLDEQFGWESVRELDTMLSRESTAVELDAAFESVFGGNVQVLLDLYAEYPDCTGKVDTTIACAGPATPGGFPSAVWEHRIDCAAADAIGPDSENAFVEQVIELGPAIALDRLVSLTGDGAEQGGFVVLQRCGFCSEEGGLGTVRGAGLRFVPETILPAGRYVARFYLPLTAAPGSVGLRIDG